MQKLDKVEYLVVHTAAYDGEHDDLEDIIRWHRERGWTTIGYHYYIRKDGTIRDGRDDKYVGAHCRAAGMNFKSLGIVFEGHHDHEEWTEDQKRSFLILAQTLMNKHNISSENIIGHREAYDMEDVPRKKTCPGEMIDMEDVRNFYGMRLQDKAEPAPLKELPEDKIDFNELSINDRL